MNSFNPSTANAPTESAVAQARSPRVVVVYSCKPNASSHERDTQAALAKRLAEIREDEFAGTYDPACRYDKPLYFVPDDTLITSASAHALGIHGEQDLFGGVVPYPFVATKTITHELPSPGAQAPQGWSDSFAQQVRSVVLPGFSAFSKRDAFDAGMRLLRHGAVRLKKPSGIGGLGQSVVVDEEQLADELESLDMEELRRIGLVLECNLDVKETRSVGQVRIGELVATYCGTQRLTQNNHGKEVYGGSNLVIVRGDFDDLLQLPFGEQVHTAIAQARTYHAAAMRCFAGMFASRCNYDIAQGVDEEGRWHSGVLEQSWRIGGASGAEVAALAAFTDNPQLKVTRASTTEIYGEHADVPPDAVVYYQGIDDKVGRITKYARIEHGDL